MDEAFSNFKEFSNN